MPSAAPRTGLQTDAAASASSSALSPASVFRDFVTRSYAAGLASLTATTSGSEEATTTISPTMPDVPRTTLSFEEQWPMPEVPQHPGLFLYGFCLVLIPTATILGNLLVIVSVLRFKALHSAINFLILGLAVADLLVALFVMPYAVYVYIQGGYWFLGPLMCDIYNASDVACSTASILLLAVISFDRYRAVSRPIQYSRQSQNIRRVFLIIIAIWLVSLALASPMVLGVNHRPADANPYECRFYNPEFSITSSVISFIIPCFLVLFVYIRIMMALRKRERAAKARRFANQDKDEGIEKSSDDDAGRIVAGPDENELCGSSTPRSSSDSLSENVHVVTNDFVSEAPTSLSRRSSDFDSLGHTSSPTSASADAHGYRNRYERKHSKGEGAFTKARRLKNSLRIHRRSLTMNALESKPTDDILPAILRQISKRSPRIFRVGTVVGARSSSNGDSRGPKRSRRHSSEGETGSRTLRSSLALNRRNRFRPAGGDTAKTSTLSSSETVTAECNAPSSVTSDHASDRLPPLPRIPHEANTAPPSLRTTPSYTKGPDHTEFTFVNAAVVNCNNNNNHGCKMYTRSITNPALAVPNDVQRDARNGKLGLIIENVAAEKESLMKRPRASRNESTSPSVTFKIAGKTFGTTHAPVRRRSSAIETSDSHKPSCSSVGMPSSISSNAVTDTASSCRTQRRSSQKSTSKVSVDSMMSNNKRQSSTPDGDAKALDAKRKLLSSSKANGSTTALAVRMVKKTLNRKDSSLKRKVKKAQRKERRATKTLGIVVGTFLVCWVPFFSINIVNAFCIMFENPNCEVGFGPFFYATWIGYMNSFMNPVIYTIFNTEFRRAFKSLILGRSAARRRRARNV